MKSEAAGKDLKKGSRTEARIKWSTCKLLERMPLSNLTIQDVAAKAKIANGTFYLYFADRQALLNAVLGEFVEFLRDRMIEGARGSGGRAAAVRRTTMVYYRLFEANRGLMKCLISYYEEFPEIAAIAAEMNRTWITLNVRSIQKQLEAEGRRDAVSETELFRRFYALGGMVDQYLSYLFLAGDENVAAISRNPEQVVDTLSDIWMKAIAI